MLKNKTSKLLPLLAATFLLNGCFAGALDFKAPAQPKEWSNAQGYDIDIATVESLKFWWEKFGDPVLTELIKMSFTDSPDRKIVEARIMEARGIQRTTRSSLFPQISGNSTAGREDSGSPFAGQPDNFYDARFDASFELDVFGVNRKASSAAEAQVEALEASYHSVSLSLIAEVARTYIDYRAAQQQVSIALKNLDIQEQTLGLIRSQFDVGEAPRLDLERSENLVNTTRASIPEFQRQAENAKLRLVVLTGQLPEILTPMLAEERLIIGANVKPVLMAPAQVLALRPDIRAAQAQLQATTDLAESVTASLFPTFSLSGFFGVADNALVSSTNIWSVAIGAAVSLLDFGRIEGQIDTARAVEMEAFQSYRKTVLEAITEVEMALNDYAKMNERRISLQKAFDNADRALQLSQDLYKEGEVSFIDVLDAQRTVNEADSALVAADAAQAEALIRLHKSLGVY